MVLVTFAETKVTQGAGRSNPQLAVERGRSPHKTYSTVTDFAKFRG